MLTLIDWGEFVCFFFTSEILLIIGSPTNEGGLRCCFNNRHMLLADDQAIGDVVVGDPAKYTRMPIVMPLETETSPPDIECFANGSPVVALGNPPTFPNSWQRCRDIESEKLLTTFLRHLIDGNKLLCRLIPPERDCVNCQYHKEGRNSFWSYRP
jgi:hypothetical protein